MIHDAALAAATEQARYRYGTVGEILHPAHMFVLRIKAWSRHE